MAVYVDPIVVYPGQKHSVFRNGSCHMIADTTEELVEMALMIGMRSKWMQDAGTHREHFDLSPSRRMEALKHGAIEISSRELALKIRAKEGR